MGSLPGEVEKRSRGIWKGTEPIVMYIGEEKSCEVRRGTVQIVSEEYFGIRSNDVMACSSTYG